MRTHHDLCTLSTFHHKKAALYKKSGLFLSCLSIIFVSFFIAFVSICVIVIIFVWGFIHSVFFHIIVFHIVSHIISLIEKFIFHIIILRGDILLIGWIFLFWLIRCWIFCWCTARSKKHTRK